MIVHGGAPLALIKARCRSNSLLTTEQPRATDRKIGPPVYRDDSGGYSGGYPGVTLRITLGVSPGVILGIALGVTLGITLGITLGFTLGGRLLSKLESNSSRSPGPQSERTKER